MTLQDALATLPSRPTAPSSAPLLVREGDLNEWDADTILNAATYDRAPYAIITGLGRVPHARLHDGNTLTTGTIDLTLLQPPTSLGATPDGADMTALAALILDTLPTVTEITTGYALTGRLLIVTETDPIPTPAGNPLRGLTAAIRLQYQIWR